MIASKHEAPSGAITTQSSVLPGAQSQLTVGLSPTVYDEASVETLAKQSYAGVPPVGSDSPQASVDSARQSPSHPCARFELIGVEISRMAASPLILRGELFEIIEYDSIVDGGMVDCRHPTV